MDYYDGKTTRFPFQPQIWRDDEENVGYVALGFLNQDAPPAPITGSFVRAVRRMAWYQAWHQNSGPELEWLVDHITALPDKEVGRYIWWWVIERISRSASYYFAPEASVRGPWRHELAYFLEWFDDIDRGGDQDWALERHSVSPLDRDPSGQRLPQLPPEDVTQGYRLATERRPSMDDPTLDEMLGGSSESIGRA